MRESDSNLLVLVERGSMPYWRHPEDVTPDDVIIGGDVRRLHHIVKARGIQRSPIRGEYKRRVNDLVLVERDENYKGGKKRTRIWVQGDLVQPTDTVVINEHNVRPYRYNAETDERPSYVEPATRSSGDVHYHRLAALFRELGMK